MEGNTLLQSVVPVSADSIAISLAETDAKFQKACAQLTLLNNMVRELQVRYDRAVTFNRQSFRYNIRLRLVSIERMRNLFYDYATHLADKLDELEDQVVIEIEDSDLE